MGLLDILLDKSNGDAIGQVGRQFGLDSKATRAVFGHLFGSKEVSRGVAARASAQTSVDSGIIEKMLPVVATLVMGALSKQTRSGQGLLDDDSGDGNLLTSLLDSDGDGSINDDLLGFAKLFF